MTADIRLIYESDISSDATELDVIEIANVCRRNNLRDDICGFMLLHDGHFTQILEGPRDKTLQLFETIRRDPRNRDVAMVSMEPIDRRRYSEWSMSWINGRGDARRRIAL